jgi:hypothetical protein
MPLNLNSIEEEIIFLNSIKEQIDSIVNYEMLKIYGSNPESNIQFETSTHQRFFNIVLVDFLSYSDKKAPVKRNSYLGALREISRNPYFNSDNSIASLQQATQLFCDWLNQEVEVEAWLASISKQVTIKITRLLFLKMCGNLSKHNILRSIGVVNEFQDVLNKSGHPITFEDLLMALADFYERFHTDILNYHSSTIAEFLNDIRWGIYKYLQPEYHRSIVWREGNPSMYGYTYPAGVENEFAKHCYWNLMNEVRSKPYVPQFQVSKWLKLRY